MYFATHVHLSFHPSPRCVQDSNTDQVASKPRLTHVHPSLPLSPGCIKDSDTDQVASKPRFQAGILSLVARAVVHNRELGDE